MCDIVGGETLVSVWAEKARVRGDHTFLTFQSRSGEVTSYTYAAFDELINRAANAFVALGVEKGERVAVQMRTCPEFMICLFGLAKIGAVTVPMNEQYLREECEYALGRCGVTLAVVEKAYCDLYRAIEADGYLPKGLVVARERCAGELFLDDLCAAQPTRLACDRGVEALDPCEIIFTSGTTSRPKGVVLTHANLVFSGHYGCWETSMRPDDRMLTTMPACHSNFQLAALAPVLIAGATLIVVEKYSASAFWSQIKSYEATLTQCVAMMLRTLMLQPRAEGERDHKLRDILYFLPVSDEEKTAFEKRFGATLQNTYGSTETVGWALTDPPVGERRWPSVGRVGLGYEVKIVDERGCALPAGEVGEICVRGVPGRTVMLRYFDDPEATAKTMTDDGWVFTGDKGYRDESGWFYFVDRKVNMIKRAGENISTTEVENVLTAHPRIAEAAVIGVDDEIRDQAVKAFVLPVAGASVSEGEVRAYCERSMAAFKVPSYIEIVSDFPRTCSMKIEKKLLK